MQLNLSADEVLKTTRSVRKRLDFDRPVERSVVEECLDIALQAPTGGNQQGWHFIVVEDEAKKKALAEIYRANWALYASLPQGGAGKALTYITIPKCTDVIQAQQMIDSALKG